jgi:MoaA/NifB/PqqE/SkfB family radical SAM enzyme
MFELEIHKSQSAKPGPKAGIFLDLALTSRCSLRCRYCSVDKTPYPELPAREWMGMVESFSRLRRIDLVSLEGGEPCLRADLSEILKTCLDCAQRVKIVTSGAIPLDFLPPDLLRHPRFFLELSVDGPREVHNFLRDGSWGQAWNFLRAALEGRVPVGLRSVISRTNLPFMESWLTRLDSELEPYGQRVDFSFDTMLFPEAMAREGGALRRAGVSRYPAQGMLPSPQEMWRLFTNLKSRTFACIRIPQGEPLRGCGFAEGGGISFDPAGFFSFCCEASRGLGWIHQSSPEHCLALLDAATRSRPCRGCFYFQEDLCHGCWTGQKCGMVEYWGAGDCQTLHRWMVQGRNLPVSKAPCANELYTTP